MKVLPALSQATSVTWRNRPSSAGSGGFGCLSGSVPSSEASCLRPNTMTTRPSGSNLITMSEPLSVTQMLSCGSIFTVCPNDQAYRFLPISRTNAPLASNSSSCVAAAAEAGPLVLPRDSTNTWPLELTETPDASPKYMLAGSFKGLGTESNGIVGTACCAKACCVKAGDPASNRSPTSQCFILFSPEPCFAFVFEADASLWHVLSSIFASRKPRHDGSSSDAWPRGRVTIA